MTGGKLLRALAAFSVLGTSLPASADIVTLEPDDFASGTDVSLSWIESGIRLRSYTSSGEPDRTLTIEAVSVVDDRRPVTGARTFGTFSYVNSSDYCFTVAAACPPSGLFESFRVLRIDFERPVDFVEVFGAHSSDPVGLYAINSANEIVATCYAQYSGDCFHTLSTTNIATIATSSVTRPIRDITSVFIGGVSGGSSVDTIRVNVPEPGTLALFALGLVLATGCRRRRETAI